MHARWRAPSLVRCRCTTSCGFLSLIGNSDGAQMSEQFAQQGHRVFYVNPEIVGLGKEEASREEISRQVKVKILIVIYG